MRSTAELACVVAASQMAEARRTSYEVDWWGGGFSVTSVRAEEPRRRGAWFSLLFVGVGVSRSVLLGVGDGVVGEGSSVVRGGWMGERSGLLDFALGRRGVRGREVVKLLLVTLRKLEFAARRNVVGRERRKRWE